MMLDNIRKSAIAGSWYPGNPKVLHAEITKFFQQVPEETIEGTVVGLVAPHAGYVYSGQVAAYAYKLVKGKSYDTVIVIGPSHRVPFRGVSVYESGGYETPLGTVPVDSSTARDIMRHSKAVSAIPHVHLEEHAIEIQLPFLQEALGRFSFVPVMMGNQDRNTCEALAEAIFRSVGNKRVLLVGSSDLSHFYHYDRAVKMDGIVLSHLKNMDAEGLLRDLENNSVEACGGGPAAVVMMAAKRLGAKKGRLLKYANSGDVTGDKGSVVGYAAAVFFTGNPSGEKAGSKGRERKGAGAGLSEGDKELLVKIAKEAIEARLSSREASYQSGLPEILKEKRGAFVTLKRGGQLRGCIGYIEAMKPLHTTIQEMAVAAAFHDPRFFPLREEEWRDVSVEISVLSPLKQIGDIDEIEVGEHGLYIMKGIRCGLLLPQVATEYNWDKMTFLRETCRKAGLPASAWQEPDARIFIFSADIFGSDAS